MDNDTLFSLLDLEIKEELDLYHRTHLEFTLHQLRKLLLQGFIGSTKDNVFNIDLGNDKIIVVLFLT